MATSFARGYVFSRAKGTLASILLEGSWATPHFFQISVFPSLFFVTPFFRKHTKELGPPPLFLVPSYFNSSARTAQNFVCSIMDFMNSGKVARKKERHEGDQNPLLWLLLLLMGTFSHEPKVR